MLDRQLHKFYISYRINGEVHLEWVDGINLRHAKERIEMLHEEAWGDDAGYTFPEYVGFDKFTLEIIVSKGKMP